MYCYHKNKITNKKNNFLTVVITIAVRKCVSIVLKSVSIRRVISIVWTARSGIGRGVSRIIGVTGRIIRKRLSFSIWDFIKVSNSFFINKFKNKNENKNRNNTLGDCFPVEQCVTYCEYNKISDHTRDKCSNKNFQYALINIDFLLSGFRNILRFFIVTHRSTPDFRYFIISKNTLINHKNGHSYEA